jgi:hypothetical protein
VAPVTRKGLRKDILRFPPNKPVKLAHPVHATPLEKRVEKITFGEFRKARGSLRQILSCLKKTKAALGQIWGTCCKARLFFSGEFKKGKYAQIKMPA